MKAPIFSGDAVSHRLIPLMSLLMLAAITTLGVIAVTSFNLAVQPELENRSRLIGAGVRTTIERALQLGIPLEEIAGMNPYLSRVMESFPEVAQISIWTANGHLVSQVEKPAVGHRGFGRVLAQPRDADTGDYRHVFQFAILSGNTLVGNISIGIDHAYAEQQFKDVFLDVLVVALVVLLLGFEIMLGTLAATFSRPLDGLFRLLSRQAQGDFSRYLGGSGTGGISQAASRYSDHAFDLHERFGALEARDLLEGRPGSGLREQLKAIGVRYQLTGALRPLGMQDTIDIRLPLFLFATGEELSKPFLPLLVRVAAADSDWFAPDVLISLPLIAYLLALILLSPMAGFLAKRYTARNTFLAALVPVAISHVGLSISDSVIEFVLWRGVAGAGYAVATIACQEYALQARPLDGHGRAMGGFVASVIGGTFCGTALGGVLSDRLGTSNTFLIGAALLVLSGLFAYAMMSRLDASAFKPRRLLPGARRSVLKCRRFLGVLFGIGIPANIVMASFLWYVVPLALADLGSRPADIGRVLMVYYLLTILVVPLAARLADHGTGAAFWLTGGAVLTGVGLLAPAFWYGFWTIMAAVALAGVGHAVIRAIQIPLVLRIARQDGAVTDSDRMLGVLRAWERGGSAIGLLLASVLAADYGYAAIIGLMGALAVAGAFIFIIIEHLGVSDAQP